MGRSVQECLCMLLFSAPRIADITDVWVPFCLCGGDSKNIIPGDQFAFISRKEILK